MPTIENAKKLLIAVLLSTSALLVAPETFADCQTQTDIPATECQALEQIYAENGGQNWNDNSNWLNDAPCTWAGINCANGKVRHINLADSGLTGEFKADLTVFSGLELLNLNFNSLSGAMPDISGMETLQLADLVSNQFSGQIPALSNLPNLSYLNLGANRFSGSLPASIGLLENLRTFVLDANNGDLAATVGETFLQSDINAFVFDADVVCAEDLRAANWLDSRPETVKSYAFCWSFKGEVNAELLGTGDSLFLSARIQADRITEPVVADLYLSLALPDGQTEAFFTLGANGFNSTLSGSTPADWIALAQNFTLNPGFDTGIAPVFLYPMSGSEPEGTYTWRLRATLPGSTELLLLDEKTFYFTPSRPQTIISAPTEILAGATAEFTAITQNELPGTTYSWTFEDGSTMAGKSVAKTFDTVNRELVKLTINLPQPATSSQSLHHVNVARPYEQTIYPQINTAFEPQAVTNQAFSWLDCGPEWNVYLGKYNQLWVAREEQAAVDRLNIMNYLALADYVFESYSEIFSWDYLPEPHALVTHTCAAIPGAGTGTGGSFFNSGIFVQEPEITLKSSDYGGTIHEFVHAWDFRGGTWINSDDPAHSFTGGMEPIVNHILGTGETISVWGGDIDLLQPLSPHFVLSHYLRVNLRRYLDRADLDWNTYYSNAFLAFGYNFEPIPANKEKMLVQGGLLMSLYQMHGKQALTDIFSQVERTLESTPEFILPNDVSFKTLSQSERAEVFMKAVADGLELDVSDYFKYWKWPVEPIAGYMARYPKSSKILDADGDGYSPLSGDHNDADASIYPYAPELVDGKDNNQDGLFDESVYIEGAEDVASTNITLPAAIYGKTENIDDSDIYRFSLNQDAVVTMTVYAKDADNTVPYDASGNRTISTFSGTVAINGSVISDLVHEAMSAPQTVSAFALPAGDHALSVTSNNQDGRNGNPGEYEIQLLINDYQVDSTAQSYVDFLYPAK